jgi:hypothetical protein
LIDERPLFSFRRESGKLLIDLALYHEDGSLLLEIDGSELRYSIDLWDVQFTGKYRKVPFYPKKPR